MEFLGYRRPDGTVGVRNLVALIPAGRCANEMACRIADETGTGVHPLLHNQPCVHVGPDNDAARRVLAGMGQNPNVAAAIVLGVGCDSISAVDLAADIAASRKPSKVELAPRYREVLEMWRVGPVF